MQRQGILGRCGLASGIWNALRHDPRRFGGSTGAILVVALCLAAQGVTIKAHDLGVSPSVEDDARQYALDFGISIEQATDRLSLQHDLNALAERAQESYPEEFAGAWIEHQPEFTLVLRFVRDTRFSLGPPDLPSDGALPVVIRTEAEYSLAQLLAMQTEFHRTVTNTAISSYVDVRRGIVTLILEPTVEETAELEELAARLGMPIAIRRLSVPVLPGHTYGGMPFSGCTTTFSVRHADGRTGVLTAGHCGDSRTYEDLDGTSYSVTFQAEFRDSRHDLQWHQTPHVEYPKFQATNGVLRFVTGQEYRSEQLVGDFVCHRGITTKYSCGTITSKTYRPTYGGACGTETCEHRFFTVEGPSLKCWPGDSGGPWFNNTTAYGLYMGQASNGPDAGDCVFAIYMGIDSINGYPADLSLLVQ